MLNVSPNESLIYMCMCVYIYICVYMCIYICVCIYVCVCICVCIYICVCICVCVCVYIYVYRCTLGCWWRWVIVFQQLLVLLARVDDGVVPQVEYRLGAVVESVVVVAYAACPRVLEAVRRVNAACIVVSVLV